MKIQNSLFIFKIPENHYFILLILSLKFREAQKIALDQYQIIFIFLYLNIYNFYNDFPSKFIFLDSIQISENTKSKSKMLSFIKYEITIKYEI